jgi:hypothetical protein
MRVPFPRKASSRQTLPRPTVRWASRSLRSMPSDTVARSTRTLGGYIVSPDRVQVPEPVEVEFINPNIDDDKKEAVIAAAVRGPRCCWWKGHPGTGKTTFITELVLQTLKANPNARVLLTSQTHVALDNSLERIVGQSGMVVSAVRIGQEDDERIAASTRKLMLDAKLPEMRKQALAAGRAFMERWALEHDLNVRDVRRAMALERHAFLKTRLEEVEVGMQASGAAVVGRQPQEAERGGACRPRGAV